MSGQRRIAKLTAPRLFGVLPRLRLFEWLDENRERPLVWIDSPPGSGKSALVASYLEARKRPHLWYQIDPGDEDPASFIHYLSTAARAQAVLKDAVLPRFLPEHLADLPAFARVFFRQLFSALPEGVMMVLDNYQELSEASVLHDMLGAAITQVAPGASVMCISRLPAPSRFAPFAATGQSIALQWDKLRLNLSEVREIAHSRGLTQEWLIHALYSQSQGWAAGVTLMLERVDVAGTPPILSDYTREATFEYFASLIFQKLPRRSQQIMEEVAFLPYVSSGQAAAITGDLDAGNVLEELYLRRMFTDRHPGAQPLYVFHALFGQFLRKRAQDRLGDVECRALRLRCASAAESSGDREAGIELRISAQDWTGAIAGVSAIGDECLRSGRRDTLSRWIEALPEEHLAKNPVLLYWQGVSYAQLHPSRGIEIMRRALTALERGDDVKGQIRCLAALLKFGYVWYSELGALDPWLDALLYRVENLPRVSLSGDLELEMWGALCSALMMIRPWHSLTGSAAQHVESLLLYATDPTIVLTAASGALELAQNRGEFELSGRIVAAVQPLLKRCAASPSELIWWHVNVAYLRFHQCQYEDSLCEIEIANRIAHDNGLTARYLNLEMFRFMVEFRVSGWDAADKTLAKVESLARDLSPIQEAHLRIYQARRCHHYGQRQQAAALATRAYHLIRASKSVFHQIQWGPICAEVMLDAGEMEEARLLLSQSRTLLEQCLRAYESHRCLQLFAEAFLSHREGANDLAQDRLRDALALAKRSNQAFLLRFLEVAMPTMFSVALEQGIEIELVRQLIRDFRLKPPMDAPDQWPWPLRVRTLGCFEVFLDDRPLTFAHKVPRKTLALMKVLVAQGGRDVPEQTLIDALWGDEEADAARESLRITVVRLRKLLGAHEVITQRGGKLSMNRSWCHVDAWVFETRVGSKDAAECLEALELYGGAFLPEDEGEAWSVVMRERLRGKFIHLLASQGEVLESAGQIGSALALYFRGIDADPVVEVFHQGVMRCYQRQGRHTEAISTYRRMRQTLSAVLGVSPSQESKSLFEKSMAACGTANVVPIPRSR